MQSTTQVNCAEPFITNNMSSFSHIPSMTLMGNSDKMTMIPNINGVKIRDHVSHECHNSPQTFHSGITDEMIKNILSPEMSTSRQLMVEHFMMFAEGDHQSSLQTTTLAPSSSVIWDDTELNDPSSPEPSKKFFPFTSSCDPEITRCQYMNETFTMKNREELFRIIDEALRHVHSSLGLQWSMLHQTQRRSCNVGVCNNNTHLTSTINGEKNNSQMLLNEWMQSPTLHWFTSMMESQHNEFHLASNVLQSNHLHTTSLTNNCTIIPEMMMTTSSQYRNHQHLDSTLESSDSSTCSSTFVASTPSKKTRKSTSQTKISKSNKTSQMHPSMKYRVRFGHNLFEEISFKKTNPHQKFIIFK
ncbi:hypothetical protein FDP41_004230 [Naegleria fowleri]|uniref:Uncharacterized protein n=1 Tax=Naegleria fowleri TaxID=5763 RepID=A0A6A5BUD0_NAEFO|nr:uncharacterized protein FDP41_004230 [Naegleria fowleri]KAF0976935.1 hypothetical protein FDP41_004230 [Naegleria fowleri]